MSKNANNIIKRLSTRKKVETRAAQLIAAEMTVRKIRKALRFAQQKVKLNGA